MKGDALASGQKSATFLAGQAEKDAPIEFHGTVAVEDIGDGCEHGVSRGRVCILCEAVTIEAIKSDLMSLEELAAKYQPMNDRVLLRRISEKDEHRVVMPDAFVQDSDIGEVIAVGDGMLIGGELRPINLKSGDKVRFGHYNAEDIELEGEKLVLVSAFDVRLKIKP
jgi:chaperonin GroES